jgi:putative ABC transport system permease protein
LLFNVSANDPATLAGVALCLAVVATVAGYIPARRAMRVDPLVALRCE